MTTGRHSWKSRAPPVSTLERWPKVSAKNSECGCADDSSAIGPTVRSCWPLVRGPCEGSSLDGLHRCDEGHPNVSGRVLSAMAAFEFVMRRGDSAVGISTSNPRRYLGSGIPPIFSAVALRVKRIGDGLHSA